MLFSRGRDTNPKYPRSRGDGGREPHATVAEKPRHPAPGPPVANSENLERKYGSNFDPTSCHHPPNVSRLLPASSCRENAPPKLLTHASPLTSRSAA